MNHFALSPRLSALAIGILLLLTPIAYAELENFQAADVVLGQPDFTQNAANNGGVSARSLNVPNGAFSDGKRLFIMDQSNQRLLIWNAIPNSNFAPADVVVGQPNFSSNAVNAGGTASARTLNTSRGIFSDGKRLFIADQTNHRVLIWNHIPTTNFAAADVVLGQPDFTSNTANNGAASPSARSMSTPRNVFSDGKRLFVTEGGNRRVLIWNNVPTTNFAPADIVLGQPDFTQNTVNNGGVSARSLNNPRGILSDGKRLFIEDSGNSRALIWNKIPTTNFAPADIVIGQPSFTSNTANNGGVSARSVGASPGSVFTDGKRFFIGESGNHRVLIWNKIPTENFAPADIVLGQPDFTSNTANNGGVSARSMNTAGTIFSDGKRLFVPDALNSRILIFNLSGSSHKPDPQFEQGKAVVGKVFEDRNGNGIQDSEKGRGQRDERREPQPSALTSQPLPEERGLEGIKIVSDTGIYAITDHDGKYHFPYIETGQRVLKLDESTLPEGSTLTTDNPYKATITRGILTKVSFGVKLPEEQGKGQRDERREPEPSALTSQPLLQVSITQDTQKPTKTLGITAELITPKDESPQNAASPLIKFTTQCNYYLFIKESEIKLYDENTKEVKTIKLPHPIPLYYEIPLKDLPKSIQQKPFYYQLVVRDAQGRSDRTRPVKMEI